MIYIKDAKYVKRIEHVSKDCEQCSQGFDIYFDDEIFFVNTINNENFYFCNDYDCWTNFRHT